MAELYDYKDKNGEHRFRQYMAENIELVDPTVNTAKELYAYLQTKDLFNPAGDIKKSEFYISVPNHDNANNNIDADGRFPYNYKYGRSAGEIQEYVKVVPFSKNNIPEDIWTGFKSQIPFVYELIEDFHTTNPRTQLRL